jgi:hypothetical protein
LRKLRKKSRNFSTRVSQGDESESVASTSKSVASRGSSVSSFFVKQQMQQMQRQMQQQLEQMQAKMMAKMQQQIIRGHSNFLGNRGFGSSILKLKAQSRAQVVHIAMMATIEMPSEYAMVVVILCELAGVIICELAAVITCDLVGVIICDLTLVIICNLTVVILCELAVAMARNERDQR